MRVCDNSFIFVVNKFYKNKHFSMLNEPLASLIAGNSSRGHHHLNRWQQPKYATINNNDDALLILTSVRPSDVVVVYFAIYPSLIRRWSPIIPISSHRNNKNRIESHCIWTDHDHHSLIVVKSIAGRLYYIFLYHFCTLSLCSNPDLSQSIWSYLCLKRFVAGWRLYHQEIIYSNKKNSQFLSL